MATRAGAVSKWARLHGNGGRGSACAVGERAGAVRPWRRGRIQAVDRSRIAAGTCVLAKKEWRWWGRCAEAIGAVACVGGGLRRGHRLRREGGRSWRRAREGPGRKEGGAVCSGVRGEVG